MVAHKERMHCQFLPFSRLENSIQFSCFFCFLSNTPLSHQPLTPTTAASECALLPAPCAAPSHFPLANKNIKFYNVARSNSGETRRQINERPTLICGAETARWDRKNAWLNFCISLAPLFLRSSVAPERPPAQRFRPRSLHPAPLSDSVHRERLSPSAATVKVNKTGAIVRSGPTRRQKTGHNAILSNASSLYRLAFALIRRQASTVR